MAALDLPDVDGAQLVEHVEHCVVWNPFHVTDYGVGHFFTRYQDIPALIKEATEIVDYGPNGFYFGDNWERFLRVQCGDMLTDPTERGDFLEDIPRLTIMFKEQLEAIAFEAITHEIEDRHVDGSPNVENLDLDEPLANEMSKLYGVIHSFAASLRSQIAHNVHHNAFDAAMKQEVPMQGLVHVSSIVKGHLDGKRDPICKFSIFAGERPDGKVYHCEYEEQEVRKRRAGASKVGYLFLHPKGGQIKRGPMLADAGHIGSTTTPVFKLEGKHRIVGIKCPVKFCGVDCPEHLWVKPYTGNEVNGQGVMVEPCNVLGIDPGSFIKWTNGFVSHWGKRKPWIAFRRYFSYTVDVEPYRAAVRTVGALPAFDWKNVEWHVQPAKHEWEGIVIKPGLSKELQEMAENIRALSISD